MRFPTELLAAVLLATSASTQISPPQPAKQLAKLEGLAGRYEGEGWVQPTPDSPKLPWTAGSSYRWQLGGHWLVEDLQIDLGPMGELVFHSYLGWDRERQHWVSHVVSNKGEISSPRTLVDGNTLISAQVQTGTEGQVSAQQSRLTWTKDGFTIEVWESDDGGESHQHVGGEFRRIDRAAAIMASAAVYGNTTTPPQLAKVARSIGTYKLTGKATLVPGLPPVAISARETVFLGYGNTLLVHRLIGEPIPGMGPAYRAWGAMNWDAYAKCYKFLWVDNMGDARVSRCNWDGEPGKQMVITWSGRYMGSLIAERSLLEFDAEGAMVGMTTDSAIGTAKPVRNFEAKYSRGQ